MRVPVLATAVAAAGLAAYSVVDPAPSHTATRDNAFIVQGARVFDGERDLGMVNVVVQDGVIQAVGADLPIPANFTVVDGSGHTLLPGFIDAHTHSWAAAQEDALRFGVTIELDMLGERARLEAIEADRESTAESGKADLWSAGAAVTAIGGHGTQFGMDVPALPPDGDARALVNTLAREGSDYIKIIVEDLSAYNTPQRLPRLTREQVEQAIAAAHDNGLLAVVHASVMEDARHAVESGAHGLVHIFVDHVADDAFVAAAAERDVFVIPTLAVVAGASGAGEGAQLAADPVLEPFVTAEQRASLTATFPGSQPDPEQLAHAIQSVRRLHAAGVDILAGSDAPNPGTAHGITMHHELQLLVRAGLSNTEALAAATSVPAERFSLTGRGRVAPGARADLVLVAGNPLDEMAATRTITSIWKNGYPVSRDISAVALDAASVPDATLVSHFDGDALDAAFGAGWVGTNDQLAGGSSVDAHRLVPDGADGSSGALEITGEIRPGFAFPWSGVMFFPAAVPMQPVDMSARTELVFQTRGDGRNYSVMVFSGPSAQGMPSIQTFVAGPEWTEITLQLRGFPGADISLLRGIAFTAGSPDGAFRFLIDQVEIR